MDLWDYKEIRVCQRWMQYGLLCTSHMVRLHFMVPQSGHARSTVRKQTYMSSPGTTTKPPLQRTEPPHNLSFHVPFHFLFHLILHDWGYEQTQSYTPKTLTYPAVCEPFSKLLVSHFIIPVVVPCIIPCVTPFRELRL